MATMFLTWSGRWGGLLQWPHETDRGPGTADPARICTSKKVAT